MDKVVKFAKSPTGAVVLTLAAVFVAEKFLGTNLAGVPAALAAKVRRAA